jgi:hypothetical protein
MMSGEGRTEGGRRAAAEARPDWGPPAFGYFGTL